MDELPELPQPEQETETANLTREQASEMSQSEAGEMPAVTSTDAGSDDESADKSGRRDKKRDRVNDDIHVESGNSDKDGTEHDLEKDEEHDEDAEEINIDGEPDSSEEIDEPGQPETDKVATSGKLPGESVLQEAPVGQQESERSQISEEPSQKAEEAPQAVPNEAPETAGSGADSSPVREELAEAEPQIPEAEAEQLEPSAEPEQQESSAGDEPQEPVAGTPQPDKGLDPNTALNKLEQMTPEDLEAMAPDQLRDLCNTAGVSETTDELMVSKENYEKARVDVSNAKAARDNASSEMKKLERDRDATREQRDKATDDWREAGKGLLHADDNLKRARNQLKAELATFQLDLKKPASAAPGELTAPSGNPTTTSEQLTSEPEYPVAVEVPASTGNSTHTPGERTPSHKHPTNVPEPRGTAPKHSTHTPEGPPPPPEHPTHTHGERTPSPASQADWETYLSRAQEAKKLDIDPAQLMRAISDDKQLEFKTESIEAMRKSFREMAAGSLAATCIAAYGNRQLEGIDAGKAAFSGYVRAIGG